MTDTTDLVSVPLSKWPRLVVVGTPVTPEQATEIIICTDSFHFCCNDDEFVSKCASYVYRMDIVDKWSLMDRFRTPNGELDYDSYQEYTDKVESEVGHVPLNYLHNERIMSSWVGGPHGWCNWDGTISTSSYNIGEWPDAGSVYEEWRRIAKAFPYLDLRCQLVTDEGEGSIAIEYHVKGGAVTLHKPGPLLQPLVEADWEVNLANIMADDDCADERGCTYEQFVAAVDYTRTQVRQRLTPQQVTD